MDKPEQAHKGNVTATDVSDALTNAQTLLTEYVEHIRNCLPSAEAEKPELRHWDFGYDHTGIECIAVNVCGEGMRQCSGNRLWKGTDDGHCKPVTILGNLKEVFDDLKAIAEPLEGDTFYIGSLKIAMFNNVIHFGSHGEGYPVEVSMDFLSKLILNLRRLQATHERQKNDAT